MSNTEDTLMLYAKLAGLRTMTIANRSLCETDDGRLLHDRLIEGLSTKIATVRKIAAIERARDPAEDYDPHLSDLHDYLSAPIPLIDNLYIDHGTKEYSVNGGPWQYGYDVEIGYTDYPSVAYLDDAELHGLGPVVRELSELGVPALAYRVVEDWQNAPGTVSVTMTTGR